MNTYQKRILMAVIGLIAAMLLYPPFQSIAGNGAISNSGYGWIFSPPRGWQNGRASINVAMLLVQWVGVILLGGLGFFLAKDVNPPDHKDQKNQKDLKGVGGWLLVLVVGMMVLGPILGAFRIAVATTLLEFDNPALKTVEAWNTYTNVMWMGFLAVAALSFYGGSGLLRGKDWLVVSRAKTILWICGPGASLVLVVLVPKMILGETGVDWNFVGKFIGNVIGVAIWTTYLSKSKRVRNTYGGLGAATDDSSRVSNRPQPTSATPSFQQPVAGSWQSVPAPQVGVAPVPVNEANFVPTASTATSPVVDDDAAYAIVAAELEGGNTDKGLWIRLYAECDGNEQKTKVAYIKQRTEKLIEAEQDRLAKIQQQLQAEQQHKAAEAAQAEAARNAEAKRIAKSNVKARIAERIAKGEHKIVSDSYGFFAAVRAGNIQRVNEMLDAQEMYVAVSESDTGNTPLHAAIAEKNEGMVRLLLQEGAPVSAVNKFGRTPLDFATK